MSQNNADTVAAPCVLTCRGCGAIVGDTFAFVGTVESLELIILTSEFVRAY